MCSATNYAQSGFESLTKVLPALSIGSFVATLLAADQGLEPQYSPPEGDVLPLDESAMWCEYYQNFIDFALLGLIKLDK